MPGNVPGTVDVYGSEGMVCAPLGSASIFYEGKHQKVGIIQTPTDEDLPSPIRQALLGVQVNIIFTYEQLAKQGVAVTLSLEQGMVLAYAGAVVDGLEEADKMNEAWALQLLLPAELDMVTFKEGEYRFVV